MNTPALMTLATELNGGASIGDTLLLQLLNLSKAKREHARPWMLLRNTDTSLSILSSNTWQTAIDLSQIARFSRFFGDTPVKIFDGTNRIDRLRQVPFNRRLEYKEASGTFIYDEANTNLYINGTVAFAGTIWIDHIKDSPDLTDDESSSWIFPSWAHPLLAYDAVSMHKGGIDYDDQNARMANENQIRAAEIVRMLEAWDNEKQLDEQMHHDPTDFGNDGWRPGAININA